MWTRRKLVDFKRLPASEHETALVTGTFVAQQSSSETVAALTLRRDEFNCVASLAYTLIPEVSEGEAVALSQWCLERWARAGATSEDVMAAVATSLTLRQCFSQVEYFFAGTDNGQLFMAPLMPPHLMRTILQQQQQQQRSESQTPGEPIFARLRGLAEAAGASVEAVPANCGPRRLVHQHALEEPVTVIDHVGTLVASGSDDHSVALSFFHPVPAPVITITQPSPIRSLKLWEGAAFTPTETSACPPAAAAAEADATLSVWRASRQEKERAAVYLFVGDEAALVRLWRVDVQARSYVLLHVLVCTQRTRPVHSSLDMLSLEDPDRPLIRRESAQSMHCLAIDDDARLIAGSEEGLYVWDLQRLSWKSSDEVWTEHPLCWDEARHGPLSETPHATPASQLAAVKTRATRLMNLHVTVRSTAYVQAQLQAHASGGGGDGAAAVSKWKPKYGRAVTGGAAVGTVTNAVSIPDEAATAHEVLDTAIVSLSFEDGELHNDIRLPLSCVEPVVYPLCFLPTYRNSCFAVEVLQPGRRLLSSGSNGSIMMWRWTADEDGEKARYVPTVVAGGGTQTFRGLGRRLCVLRAPDVFVSCGYDDGLVKEWHVYEEPELVVRCERRFTMMPTGGYARAARGGGGAGQVTSEGDAARQAAEAMTTLVNGKRGEDAEAQKAKDAAQRAEETAQATGSSDSDDDKDDDDPDAWKKGGEVVGGISCAVAFPAFGALFLVGAFESTVQTFSLAEVQGCEAPRNFLYNGFKTVKLPASLVEDAYRQLDAESVALLQ